VSARGPRPFSLLKTSAITRLDQAGLRAAAASCALTRTSPFRVLDARLLLTNSADHRLNMPSHSNDLGPLCCEIARSIDRSVSGMERHPTPIPHLTLTQTGDGNAHAARLFPAALRVSVSSFENPPSGCGSREWRSTCEISLLDLPMADTQAESGFGTDRFSFELALDHRVIFGLAREMDIHDSRVASSSNVVIEVMPSPLLLDAVLRMLRLLECPADIPVLAKSVEREIWFRLLESSARPALLALVNPATNLNRVHLAVAWIRRHYAESFKAVEVANYVGMSASSFARHFKTYTSVAPIEYQRLLRLLKARDLLLTNSRVNVTARTVGYTSVSQFAREYRRFYGTSPSGRHKA
jgi:AraC-like DNA-binding protein